MMLSSQQIADILTQVSEANLPCAGDVVKLVDYYQNNDELAGAVSEKSGPVGERSGIDLIAAERLRQVSIEGWTAEHDDAHLNAEMAEAATCYAAAALYIAYGWDPQRVRRQLSWPWSDDCWKPSSNPIRNLVKAGALIAAEIDRLQRAQATALSDAASEPETGSTRRDK